MSEENCGCHTPERKIGMIAFRGMNISRNNERIFCGATFQKAIRNAHSGKKTAFHIVDVEGKGCAVDMIILNRIEIHSKLLLDQRRHRRLDDIFVPEYADIDEQVDILHCMPTFFRQF